MKMSKEKRASLPSSSFAGPDRSFPINDPEHARKALQLAPRSEHAGNISHEQAQHIESAARAKLARYKSSRSQ